MIGTILNVAGILVGGVAGLAGFKPLAPATQAYVKMAIGAFTVFYGLRLTWISMGGSFLQILKQLLVVLVALMLGKLTGHLLHLQALSNALGRSARERMSAASNPRSRAPDDGFKVCAVLFCAAPLGILGSIQDGLSLPEYFYPLAIKAVIEGLAAFGFVPFFGWTVLMSVLPVLAFQGSITLLCAYLLRPYLAAQQLIDPVNAVGGLLVFSVALIILDVKKLEVTDYLPSLFFAPLLTALLR
jgi:uncharacterized protein